MDYQERLQRTENRAKKVAIITVSILILAVFIVMMIGGGGLNREERTEDLVRGLSGESFYGSGNLYGKMSLDFEDDSTGRIFSGDEERRRGNFNYSIAYSPFGMEYVVMDITWDDGSSERQKLEIGKNHAGEILVLGKIGKNSDYCIQGGLDGITPEANEVIYANGYGQWIIIVALFVVCMIINGVFISKVFDIKEEPKREEQRRIKERKQEERKREQEERKKEQERIESKRQLLIKTWNEKMEALCCNEEDSVRVLNNNWLWVANGNLYEAEDIDRFVKRCLNQDLEKYAIEYSCISVSNIQYFSAEGDVQYTTRISGGGGGGSTITGAIVGGLLAGETGAIVGSRKKVAEIKSESITHDSRNTLIRYYRENELLTISYDGFDVYNYLLKKMPEKDLLSMQLKGANQQKDAVKTNLSDIEEKMLTIKRLHEAGLISKEEFEEKRTELLTQI